jgi:hypothetical protein
MLTNPVFAVFREGIQRHECGGIFTKQSDAEKTAYALINGEPDDYHTYTVVEFILDEPSLQIVDGKYGEGELVEEPPVLTLTRNKTVVTAKRGS